MKKLLFTLFILLAPTLASAATLGKVPSNNIGLVGYWTFDGAKMNPNVMDSSGNGNNGTLINAAGTGRGWPSGTTTIQGKFGQALNWFDSNGGNIGISLGTPSSLNDIETQGGGGMTASAWVYFSSSFAPAGAILQGETDCTITNDGRWRFALLIGGTLTWCKGYATTRMIVTSVSSAVPSGQWSHVVVTWDGTSVASRVHQYVNGAEVSSYATQTDGVGTKPSDASYSKYIGNGVFTGNDDYFGAMDDVRLYNRVLSSTEIKALYNSGSAGVARSSVGSTTAPLSNGLVGYWTLDGSKTNWATGKTTDSAGGNAGTLVGLSTSTSPTQGKVGQSLQFNGVNSFVDLNATLLDAQQGVTLAAWVYPTDTGFYPGILVKTDQWVEGGTEYGLVTSFTDLRPEFIVGGNFTSSLNSLPLNSWSHVVAVNNASVCGIYVNGVLDTACAPKAAPASTPDTWKIGAYVNGVSGHWVGKIDDARIYNRALSVQEIQALYNSSLPKIASSGGVGSSTPLSSGLVGYWTFDGSKTNWATGKTTDSSGSGNTGTLTSLSTTTAPVAGKVGQAFNFDGTGFIGSFLSAPVAAGASMTACAWINPQDTTNRTIVADRDSLAIGWQFAVNRTTAGNLSLIHNSDVVEVASGILTNVWTHACVSWNSVTTNAVFYANGVTTGNSNIAADATRSGLPFRIGYSGATTFATPFLGKIDDVRIYNRVLTASEIQQLYNMAR